MRHAGSSLQRGPAVFAHLASVPPCEEREIRLGSTCSSPQKNLETELTGARGAPVRPMGSLPRRSPMAPGHRDWFPAKPDISPSLSARAYLNSLAESAGWRGGCGEGLAGRVLAWPWGAGSRRAPGVTGARGPGTTPRYIQLPPATGVPLRRTRGGPCGTVYNVGLCRDRTSTPHDSQGTERNPIWRALNRELRPCLSRRRAG